MHRVSSRTARAYTEIDMLCNKSKHMKKNGGGVGELTEQLGALAALAGD